MNATSATSATSATNATNATHLCRVCGDDVEPRRFRLGYRVCLWCGEEAATTERMGWCVVQEYGKGPYQLVTPAAAPVTLKQTNQKDPR